MNTFFDSYDKYKCNGCGICALKCPKKAIEMVEDDEGFLYPKIDKTKCIDCGICKKICSNSPDINDYVSKAFAAKNKDDHKRNESTSGGVFKVLAEYVINEKNGVVFGAQYDEKLNVIHNYTNNIDELCKFSISKYVRSDMTGIYTKILDLLKEGVFVLFTGTPCQCYALNKYLGKDYDNLIICEIICHSNPSPKIYNLFKENIELETNKKIKKVMFRNKSSELNGMPYVELDDGEKVSIQPYNDSFNSMLISRPSCSDCKFASTNRKADITIGDFWGIEHVFPTFQDNKGISLLCINSIKGLDVFNCIKDKIEYLETTLDLGFKYNHNSNIPENKRRKKFFDNISNNKINNTNIIRYMKDYSKKNIMSRVVSRIKRMIKKNNKLD